MFTDYDRIHNFALVVNLLWNPDGEGVERFTVIKAGAVALSSLFSVGQLDPDAVASIKFPPTSATEATPDAVQYPSINLLVCEDYAKTICNGVSLHSVRGRSYNPDWLTTLKQRTPTPRFPFED